MAILFEYFELFESLGEPKVREHLSLGQFDAIKAEAARNWLEQRERNENKASQSEKLAIAHDARDAAWAAARAARTANKMAKIAIAVAVISVIVAGISIFA